MLTGLSQRVAYFYPTGVTLLHTSSPSSLRAWLRAVAWTWVCIEVTWASVARRGLFWHGARFHQPWGGTKSWQEEYPCAEPRFPGRGAPVVAWQGKKSTEDCSEIVFLKQTNKQTGSCVIIARQVEISPVSFVRLVSVHHDWSWVGLKFFLILHLLRSSISFIGWCEVCEHWSNVLRAGSCELQRRAVSVEVEWIRTLQESTGDEFNPCYWKKN